MMADPLRSSTNNFKAVAKSPCCYPNVIGFRKQNPFKRKQNPFKRKTQVQFSD